MEFELKRNIPGTQCLTVRDGATTITVYLGDKEEETIRIARELRDIADNLNPTE